MAEKYSIESFSPHELSNLTALFRAYAVSLGIDLSFQDFEAELATLPGKYAPPDGALFVARAIEVGDLVGCICVRRLSVSRSPTLLPTAPKLSTTQNSPRELLHADDKHDGKSRSDEDADRHVCEMKRLYVSPHARGAKLGLRLATTAIHEARRLEYVAMRLDTLPSMVAARNMYQGLGFEEIDGYYDTPVPGTIFMELDLRGGGGDMPESR